MVQGQDREVMEVLAVEMERVLLLLNLEVQVIHLLLVHHKVIQVEKEVVLLMQVEAVEAVLVQLEVQVQIDQNQELQVEQEYQVQ